MTLEELSDCIATGPERGEVGYVGDIDELREYPCNCMRCRGLADDRVNYHDGETDWWRCDFCSRHFAIEDVELLSGDGQGCEPCVGAWLDRVKERYPR